MEGGGVGAIEAVLIDLGGVVYLPDHDRMLAALARLGVRAEPADLDRAHYAGVAATSDFTSDHSVWHAYTLAYARVHGVPDEDLDDARAVLLEVLGVTPERAVHVGDTPAADVAGARAAGVHPVLVDPFDHHPDIGCLRVTALAEVVALLAAH